MNKDFESVVIGLLTGILAFLMLTCVIAAFVRADTMAIKQAIERYEALGQK